MSARERGVNRRGFLAQLAAGAGATAAGATLLNFLSRAQAQSVPTPPGPALAAWNEGAFGVTLTSDPQAASAPELTQHPNILIIMVDQLRLPQLWTSSTQQSTIDSIAPNIAWLRKNSVNFTQFYVAATACTPSRAALLTGLYAPQTAQFTTEFNGSVPALSPAFPTFGAALQGLAPAYSGKVFWFGKWHLSGTGATPLASYGFNTSPSFVPTWPDTDGSPNGSANEGNNGETAPQEDSACSTFYCKSLASDIGIANDFTKYWASVSSSSPWCAVVSLVNPHDIGGYPCNFYPGKNGNLFWGSAYTGLPYDSLGDFYPLYDAFSTTLFSSLPSTFNYETSTQLLDKNLALQSYRLQVLNASTGQINESGPYPSYVDFLNWYFYMISLVDAQIGAVLGTVLGPNYSAGGNPSANTVVVFLADHGEFGGSHGLHGKGGAVYDENLRVPLYVMLPAQSGQLNRAQMCSGVDFFRLIAELGIGQQTDSWWVASGYPDQAQRQSLQNFISTNAAEKRVVSINGQQTPYILTTTDEIFLPPSGSGLTYTCSLQSHVVALRTKSYDYLGEPDTGAKYAIYSKWALDSAPNIDPSTPQQMEFYDYTTNRNELGNNYSASDPSSTQTAMASALGNGPVEGGGPATGLIASELMAPLTGPGLASASASAMSAYNAFVEATLGPGGVGCTS